MIVTPRRPAPGRDRPARAAARRGRGRGRGHAARARRAGGERGRVGRASSAARRGSSASAPTTRPAEPPPQGSSATASRSAARSSSGRTGTVVSLVGVDGGRTMASDRGVSPDLRAEELDPAWLDGCTHLHLPGYSLLRSPIDEAALRAAELAPQRERRPLLLERDPRLRPGAVPRAARGAAARDRVRERGRGADPRRAARGVHVDPEARRARRVASATSSCRRVPAEALDTTGAGDALAAGYLVGGPELALAAAARCVAQLGSMP